MAKNIYLINGELKPIFMRFNEMPIMSLIGINWWGIYSASLITKYPFDLNNNVVGTLRYETCQ